MNLARKASAALLYFAVVTGAAMAQISPDDLLKLPLSPGAKEIHYGSGPLQFGELRIPAAKGLVPVVILVHGGCWVDRLPGQDSRITTYELLRPLASALTAQGVATWNIEYRRSGSPGGGWPATYLDLGNAMDYLREIAVANRLDLARVVVLGHSSGGQLAFWMGARSKLPTDSALYVSHPLVARSLIDVDGPPELAQSQALETDYCPVPGISQLMGGKPSQQPLRYKQGAAQAFLPLGVPQIIVSALLGQAIAPIIKQYTDEAEKKGDSVRVLTLEKSGHFDMLNPSTSYGLTVISNVLTESSLPKK